MKSSLPPFARRLVRRAASGLYLLADGLAARASSPRIAGGSTEGWADFPNRVLQVVGASGGVNHDGTMTGNGSLASPLSVISSGNPLAVPPGYTGPFVRNSIGLPVNGGTALCTIPLPSAAQAGDLIFVVSMADNLAALASGTLTQINSHTLSNGVSATWQRTMLAGDTQVDVACPAHHVWWAYAVIIAPGAAGNPQVDQHALGSGTLTAGALTSAVLPVSIKTMSLYLWAAIFANASTQQILPPAQALLGVAAGVLWPLFPILPSIGGAGSAPTIVGSYRLTATGAGGAPEPEFPYTGSSPGAGNGDIAAVNFF